MLMDERLLGATVTSEQDEICSQVVEVVHLKVVLHHTANPQDFSWRSTLNVQAGREKLARHDSAICSVKCRFGWQQRGGFNDGVCFRTSAAQRESHLGEFRGKTYFGILSRMFLSGPHHAEGRQLRARRDALSPREAASETYKTPGGDDGHKAHSAIALPLSGRSCLTLTQSGARARRVSSLRKHSRTGHSHGQLTTASVRA